MKTIYAINTLNFQHKYKRVKAEREIDTTNSKLIYK